MVAEHDPATISGLKCCSLAKISMVAEHGIVIYAAAIGCSLAKISMVAELSEWFR